MGRAGPSGSRGVGCGGEPSIPRLEPGECQILCGLPFAGKSTLARALAQWLGVPRVELDAINGERGLGLNAAPISLEQWDETYAEAYRRLDQQLAGGRSVIFDAASFTRRQRDDLRAIAARYSACVRVIWLDVPEEIVVARWRLNRETGERYDERYDVRDDDFAQVLTSFEAPGKDENVLRYDQSEPLAEWIERTV